MRYKLSERRWSIWQLSTVFARSSFCLVQLSSFCHVGFDRRLTIQVYEYCSRLDPHD